MCNTKIYQAGFFQSCDNFYGMTEGLVGRPDKSPAVVCLSQGIGADSSYINMRNFPDPLSKFLQAYEGLVHRFIGEVIIFIQTGGKTNHFFNPVDDLDSSICVTGDDHVETV